ncbi:MAG: NAD+ synthase [Legionella sp.]
MPQTLKILMAQINPLVGATAANSKKIIDIILAHQDQHDLIVFPELAITGYPPEDLLFHKEFLLQVNHALDEIRAICKNCHVIVGHPLLDGNLCYNAASIFFNGISKARYHKQNLPNYEVFDEKRYFSPGPNKPCIFTINDYRLGLCICEDIWSTGPVEQLIAANIEHLICINASPFDYNKYQRRETLLANYAQLGLSTIYVNQIGGQDNLVFDGQSFAMNNLGEVCARSPAFEESLTSVLITNHTINGSIAPPLKQEALIYKALVCGLRDYIEKNKFPGVIIGLSGGIDSALVLALAVDAIGPSRVHAVLMPSQYTASMSNEDAQYQATIMQVEHTILGIESIFNCFLTTLAPVFKDLSPDLTEENLQARIRGTLLMALSNKTGKMVLCTSNKSETAVGYSTIYGDMVGGFAVIKDVLKTQVYALARYRNTLSNVIPERVFERPPSAELAPNQTDQDTLPDYKILDAMITMVMEENLSSDDIIAQGYAAETVKKVLKLIKRNEYKRRQSAPGIKISRRAFGPDWRYPITSGF